MTFRFGDATFYWPTGLLFLFFFIIYIYILYSRIVFNKLYGNKMIRMHRILSPSAYISCPAALNDARDGRSLYSKVCVAIGSLVGLGLPCNTDTDSGGLNRLL